MEDKNLTSRQKRVISIDILKFMAVFLVLNSHLDSAYGEYSFLATGGSFGDALFFFASGFMLFRGPTISFWNYYKKRISRIYPTVFVVAIVGALLYNRNENIIQIILFGGGWFVSCIMIYYIFLWIIKKWFLERMYIIWLICILVIVSWYYIGYDSTKTPIIYGDTYFKWSFFFLFMLQGAIMGLNPSKYKFTKWTIPNLIICISAWYGILIASRISLIFERLQFISIIPLMGITYYVFCFCSAPFWHKIYNHKIFGQIIFIVGGLCLECYLIQGFLITNKLNSLFPLNIPILILTILLISYVINACSSIFSQTFHKEEYDPRKFFLRK